MSKRRRTSPRPPAPARRATTAPPPTNGGVGLRRWLLALVAGGALLPYLRLPLNRQWLDQRVQRY